MVDSKRNLKYFYCQLYTHARTIIYKRSRVNAVKSFLQRNISSCPVKEVCSDNGKAIILES